MQNVLKMESSKSSVVVLPTISPKISAAKRKFSSPRLTDSEISVAASNREIHARIDRPKHREIGDDRPLSAGTQRGGLFNHDIRQG